MSAYKCGRPGLETWVRSLGQEDPLDPFLFLNFYFFFLPLVINLLFLIHILPILLLHTKDLTYMALEGNKIMKRRQWFLQNP